MNASVEGETYPLTSPQRDIYQDQILKGDSPCYNIGGFLEFTGDLRVDIFEEALQRLIQTCDNLRIAIVDDGAGEAEQAIADEAPTSLETLDLSACADPRGEARAWIQRRMDTPFALTGEPLFRWALLKIDRDRALWFICVHHLIADGWALDAMFSRLAAIYRELEAGQAPPARPPSYLDAVAADRAYLASDRFEADRAFWRAEYASLPEPLLSPRHERATEAGSGERSWKLSPALNARIDAAAAATGASKFHVVLALFCAFFLRLRDRDALTLGLSVLNRRNAEERRTPGLFSNVIPLTLDLAADETFAQFAAKVGPLLRRRYRHQRYPIGQLNKDLDLFRRHRSQLYELSISYENGGRELVFGAASATTTRCSTQFEATPLRLTVRDNQDAADADLHLVFDHGYVTDAEAEAIQARFSAFMDAVLARPDAALTAFSVATDDEMATLRAWNATEAPGPDDRCLHEVFEAQVERNGDAVALVHESGALSYAELNAKANRIAHAILASGVQPDDRVALCTERGVPMIAGLLSILKAGGAYLPVDPAYASERTRQVLEDARPVLLLTDAAGRAALGDMAAACPTLAIDGDDLPSGEAVRSNPGAVDVRAHHLAYVIYTSGSTGRPKGVMVEHRNVRHQVAALQQVYGLRPDERILQFASPAFDMSVEEIFPALLTGATLVLRTDACLQSPADFAAFCARHAITHLNLPSGFWAQIALETPEVELPAGLRRVASGGDALSAPAVAAWLARTGHRPQLFNAYGPTEATVNASVLHVEAAEQAASIGRPLRNTQAHLLDRFGQPVAIGEVGELHIGGAGLARGYLHAPELTTERFPPDPFARAPGARMYRSGDLARHRPDGSLEFLGRTDHQVKIRGHRVETGEIEARLTRLPAVREAAVVAWGERPDQRLAAYVVAASPQAEEAGFLDACRAALAAALPDPMVPAAFIRLEALPLTPSGKLDRKALPDPAQHGPARPAYAPPRDAAERALAGLWEELLGVEHVGRRDNFFDLGGHSLVAMRLLGRVRQAFGRPVTLQALFDHPTLAALAAAIGAPQVSEEAAGAACIPRAPRAPLMPLSHAQQRLWFLAQLEPAGAAYHIPLVLHLRGELDTGALRRALDHLLARHEALRTVFTAVEGRPMAQVLPDTTPFALAEHDLTGEADPQARAAQYARAYAEDPFDLRHGPLIRAALLRVGADRFTLLITLHHIAGDGWSMEVLARELGLAYAAASQGRAADLPPLPIQYPDYAAWRRSEPASARLETQLAYWREQLKGAPELLHLPTDRPRPERQSFAGAAVPVHIAAPLARGLKALGRRCGATPFMVVAAAWSMVLARLSGQDDVLLGALSANRGQPETEGLIGFFVNTLVLRTDLAGDPSAVELVEAVRRTVLALQENGEAPFEQVVEVAGPSRRLEHAPLFQALFAWQSNEKAMWSLPGVDVEAEPFAFTATRYDLELHLLEQDEAITGLLGYATALFDAATIVRWRDYLVTTLAAMVAEPEAPFRRLPLVGPEERARLRRWNQTDAPLPAAARVHQLFEAQAKRTPDAVALVHDERRLSYAELDALAERWAQALRRRGAAPGARVAICVERSFAMIAGVLAILKAGAAYVPLDPSYPAARLQQVLGEADAALVLVDAGGRAALGGDASGDALVDVAMLDDAARADPGDDALPSSGEADDLAYVIYTSGSTGAPKGVAMPHRPLVNLVAWQLGETVRAGLPPLRTLQFAALGFDVAFQEIFTTLASGAALVLVDSAVRMQFAALAELLHRQGVQRLFLPYVALQALADALEGDPSPTLIPALRQVIVAGEQLRLTPQIRRLFARLPQCALHNHYGPTETHVATAEPLAAGDLGSAPAHVPIGRPIANARTYLLDAYGEPVPLGATGELFVGGAGVAQGYLDRPDLTAERFLADPFDGRPGGRMYRTGDLARFLPDGRLVYAGRNDRQVKVRGFRVEVGEIEAQLAEHVRVRECAVVARGDAQGGLQLVAYTIADGDAAELAAELRAHLERRLPGHAVPAAFVALDALPLTPSGKLDRDALPAPDAEAFAHAAYAAPQGATETRLAELWRELLDVPRVGRRDRFFDLGGHSLLAVRLLSRVEQAFGVRLALATLFAAPALGELAAAVDAQARLAPASAAPPVTQTARTERLPLSHAQERLWVLSQLNGANSAPYHVQLAFRLRGRVDVDALQRSLDGLAARHESLRTTFRADRGRPYATLLPAHVGVHLQASDLRGRGDAEARLRKLLADERNRPFDISAGPLMRAALLRMSDDRCVLQIVLHHIVADGWSLGVLARDLGGLYAEALEGAEPPARPPSIQYADYVAWERTPAVRARAEAQADYWRRQLSGAPLLLELPTDRPRPARQTFEGASVPFAVDAELTLALKALARRHGVTLLTVLLAGWSAVLSRLTHQEEVVVGVPTAGRGRAELEDVVGFFVNTLALRLSLAEPQDAAALLAHVHKVSLEAQAHQDVPFEQVVELAGAARRLDRTPLIQAILAWQDEGAEAIDLPGVKVEARVHDFDWVKFELELVLGEAEGEIRGALNYAAALFDRETIERHAQHLEAMLEALARDDAQVVQQAPLAPGNERRLLFETWSRGAAPPPDGRCIHQLVETWAKATPDAPALVFGDRSLTYAELDARANRLAAHLVGLGMRPGDRIASLFARGFETILAPLAVMKAGGVHVPLDPAHASARLTSILDDASPAWVLCDATGADALAAVGGPWPRTLDITRDEVLAQDPADPPAVAGLDDRSLAYMIYTSGSTGAPKGVLVEHHGVVGLALSLGRSFDVGGTSRVSQFASPSFDASIMEMVLAFAAGAALHVPTCEERESPAAFVDFVARRRISHATLPPAFLQGCEAPTGWTHRPALILAGEAPGLDLVRRWREHARVFNAYGPTEISICATVWACPGEGELTVVPIGRPVDQARLYVLDRHGQPALRGAVGELHVGGGGVARGYWRRPELTAARFTPDPFDERPGARMYRTGDLVRHLPDGDLLFVGRDDGQVKLRGYRIELGEIEAQLEAHPAVQAVAVLLREDTPGDRRLVAYVATQDGAADLPATLRAHLAARLPDYMVPAAFVASEALPLTSSGKLDRRALPPPLEDAFARRDYEAPQGAAETTLAALWRELLGVEAVGRRDDFFDLGGHSLRAVRLAALMRDAFGTPTTPRDVFQRPVLRDLAATVGGDAPAAEAGIDLATEVRLDVEIVAGAPAPPADAPREILLTGATGFVGAFLLQALLERTSARVCCLVRCADAADGWRKLDANMRRYDLPRIDRARVSIQPGDLGRPRLGLDARAFGDLAARIDTIHHNGARVDALHSYASLKAANVAGTQEVLRLAATLKPKRVHFVSTLTTIPPVEAVEGEVATAAELAEAWPALSSGYGQSKWVAERIVRLARSRGIAATTYRLTHVGGALPTGASNPNDTWSLFVDACLALRCVPAADGPMDSLPVDVAAAALVALSLDAGLQEGELNLRAPDAFRLRDLTQAILDVGGAGFERIGDEAWRRRCLDELGDARLSLVLPEESARPEGSADPDRAPIALPNALAEGSGFAPPRIGGDALRRYVAWRYRLHLANGGRTELKGSGGREEARPLQVEATAESVTESS